MSERDTRRAVATVFLVVFVDLVGFGILIPVIPLYAESFGASEFLASLLIATYSAFQFLFAPVLGRLSDERGRRPILLLSLSGSVLAWTLFGLAEPIAGLVGVGNALWVLFLARMLAGAMGGNVATAQAYVADVTDPDDRAKYLGLLGAAFGLGFVFGPALGFLLSSPPVIDAVAGTVPAPIPVDQFTLPSFGAAAITAANLLAAAAFLPESRPPEDRRDADSDADADVGGLVGRIRERFGTVLAALRTPGLGSLVAGFFVVSFAFSALESQFIFFTNDVWGYGTNANAAILVYVGLVVAVVQGGLVGPLADRFGEYRLALAGAGIQLVTLSTLPFAPELAAFFPDVGPLVDQLPVVPAGVVVFLVVLTVLSFGNAITNVSLNTLVSTTAGDDDQGGAFGITQSAGSLARTVGPATAGALYTGIDYWAPFLVGGLLFLPVVYLVVGVERELVRPARADR